MYGNVNKMSTESHWLVVSWSQPMAARHSKTSQLFFIDNDKTCHEPENPGNLFRLLVPEIWGKEKTKCYYNIHDVQDMFSILFVNFSNESM